MPWNIGKEMSENYEFIYIAYMGLIQHQGSEEDMVNFVKTSPLLDNKDLYNKPLGSDFLRMLNNEKEPLALVLKAHLFVEHFLDAIFAKKFKCAESILKNPNITYAVKIDILRAKNYLDDKLYNNIRLLNNLRNKFAHNLYYSLADFDVSRFSYCEDFDIAVQPPTRKAAASAKFHLLKFVLYNLLVRFTKRYPFVADLNVPENVLKD